MLLLKTHLNWNDEKLPLLRGSFLCSLDFLRVFLRWKAIHYFPVLVDEVFREIPFDSRSKDLFVSHQVLEKRMGMFSLHINFTEHRRKADLTVFEQKSAISSLQPHRIDDMKT